MIKYNISLTLDSRQFESMESHLEFYNKEIENGKFEVYGSSCGPSSSNLDEIMMQFKSLAPAPEKYRYDINWGFEIPMPYDMGRYVILDKAKSHVKNEILRDEIFGTKKTIIFGE
jgi:hypothetical protein